MNTKKHLWNRLLAVFLIAALMMAPTLPGLALAVETDETTPAPTETSPTPTEDVGEGTDTTPTETPPESPENGPVTVSTLEELLQAIDEAEEGAVIGVGSEIDCPDGTILGSPDHAVTIQRMAPEGHIYFTNGDGTGTGLIQNITFDGAYIESNAGYIGVSLGSTAFVNCNFVNCAGSADGAALTLSYGDTTLTDCAFDNNSGGQGAHLRIDGTTAQLENCSFTNGTATMKGGAIMNCSYYGVTLTGCTITGNTADQCGGGIYNVGTMALEGCKIYGNTANGEVDDLASEYWGRLALMDDHAALVDLYAEDGLIPNLWAVDTYQDEWAGPMEDYPTMIFKMTFAADDPEPTPDPEPAPSTSSGGHSRPVTTPTPAPEPEPEETTLTNGKAVLEAPEALYWAGYKDSRGGGAEAVTRADLAFLILSMMDDESRETYFTNEAPFDDVEPASWYAAAIGTMENTGIMVGCGNGLFRPDRLLTWGELITVMTRFTDDEAPPEVYTGQHWAKDAINTAISLGWVEYSEAFDPGGTVSTGEMVDFIQTVFLWASD